MSSTRSTFWLAPLVVLGACSEAPAPAALVAPAPPPAAPAPPLYGDAAQLGRWVDAYASAFGARWGEAYAMQGYLAIAVDGAMVFQKAYGKADREAGTVATDDTLFRVGSLTKQFTAAAALTLAQRGRLRLEAPIRAYLPEYPAAVGDRVTVHQLLTHTSGIPSYTNDEALMKRRDAPIEHAALLATFQSKPLEFEPGSKFAYSNSGYFLLGVIVERVSGKTYEDYLRENVLRPAGLTRTTTLEAPGTPNVATGYEVNELDEMAPVKPIDMSFPFAAGALHSTARELVAWDVALRGGRVLDAAWQERMYQPERDNYAYGWRVSAVEGKRMLSHSGSIDGFNAHIARVPEAKLVVVALLNNEELSARAVVDAALRMALSGQPIEPKAERATAALDADLLERWCGDYALRAASRGQLEAKPPGGAFASLGRLALTAEAGRLFVEPAGRPRLRVFRGEDGGLFTKRSGIELAEEGGAPGGPVRGLALKEDALVVHYERAGACQRRKVP